MPRNHLELLVWAPAGGGPIRHRPFIVSLALGCGYSKIVDGFASWSIFAIAFAAAGLGGFSALLGSDRPLTLRSGTWAIFWHGSIGSGIGMLGYEYLGWKARPAAIVGFAFLWGAGIVSLEFIKTLVSRMLGGNGGSDVHKP